MSLIDFFFVRPTAPTLAPKPIVLETEELRTLELKHLDQLCAASSYSRSPELKRAIGTFKYRRVQSLKQALAQLITEASFPQAKEVVLCPVPLHWRRKFWRGFNQAEQLADKIGEALELPVRPLLKRQKDTGQQAKRVREARFNALKEAFIVQNSNVPSSVILIDDVATTGATLDDCARALKSAGAQTVAAWVVAHDPR